MSSNLSRNWAIAASAIALVLLGVVIGQYTSRKSNPEPVTASVPQPAPVSGNTFRADVREVTTDTEGEGGDGPAPFVIPEAFVSLPSEWRTEFEDGDYHGYAILFDPPRREVIIEKCFHPGHFDQDTGQPISDGWEFCDSVLWGQLESLDEHSAHVRARDGAQLDLDLALSDADGQTHLALSFPGHQMELIPGSKNDLFQAMDQSPQMAEQRKQKFEFIMDEEDKLRQQSQMQNNGTGSGDDKG
jgi:hypothetical protein